jgi:hypothetical protein
MCRFFITPNKTEIVCGVFFLAPLAMSLRHIIYSDFNGLNGSLSIFISMIIGSALGITAYKSRETEYEPISLNSISI